MAVAAPGRRTDRDEHRICATHSGRQLGGEAEPSRGDIGSNEIAEFGLENRHLPGVERSNLVIGLVDTDHFMTEVGETGA